MKFSTVQKAFIALIIANIIWGAAAPIFKLSLQNIPPFTLAFWRFFLGSLLLLVIFRQKLRINIASRRDFFLLLGYALCGITGNIIFYFLGLRLTFAMNAPVIGSAQPIITLILALVFLREKFAWKKFIGMILGSMGVLVIIFEPLLEKGVYGSILGNVFLTLAMLLAVAQTIFGKSALDRYSPLAFTFWAFIIGAASFTPLAFYEYFKIPQLYQTLDWRGFAGIGFGAVFSSAAAYTLYAWGLSKITASDTSVFSYIDPVVGTVLAFFLLKEPITPPFVVGSFLIFGGIFLAEGRLHYHPIRRLIMWEKPIRYDKPEALPTSDDDKPPNRKRILTSIFQK
ncbi:DMT family transporter [Patescibacteria group bacterium]|nr:DMT family transporter [Patescibacteria group bacterium]MBU1472476.1 DMT family transporter [Patescibacteria group bacterium]MBU2460290.1 DMT family transporter [Patescibacteria group bacterium]MBU2543852.1 DMT family transporter [Patescibacteria group bacterium]